MAADTAVPDKETKTDGNVKETVESILVAFILAFIFRAFVVEAFVIPTGSMAPTLYGAHMRFRCPDCGYSFDVGYSAPRTQGEDEPNIPAFADQQIDYHCPNCGYAFPKQDPVSDRVVSRPIRFGDRILVLKYLYLFQHPKRGDTVVFKSPSELGHDTSDPDYAVNYIKRLIGMGPESIVILDGDVYVGPLNYKDHRDFHIWRKPEHVQNVLWRNIYDNDFIPHLSEAERGPKAQPWNQPWQQQSPDSGTWKLGRSRVFSFDGANGSGTISFNPQAMPPSSNALTDYLGYDEYEHITRSYSWRQRYVSDLKLACYYTRRSGDGPLRLLLTKNDDCFIAEITPGAVSLRRAKITSQSGDDNLQLGPEQTIRSASVGALKSADPVHIELINVDYRVSVRINDREILATKPEEYAPDVERLWKQALEPNGEANMRPRIQISASRQACDLEHVQLARDIYYLNSRPETGSPFWGSPEKPVQLNKGEYFVMGDNSFISGDARYWVEPVALQQEQINVQAGRVPEQFMLGKAFFVYWPAGYRLPGSNVNIVPDFGDMRFIH